MTENGDNSPFVLRLGMNQPFSNNNAFQRNFNVGKFKTDAVYAMQQGEMVVENIFDVPFTIDLRNSDDSFFQPAAGATVDCYVQIQFTPVDETNRMRYY